MDRLGYSERSSGSPSRSSSATSLHFDSKASGTSDEWVDKFDPQSCVASGRSSGALQKRVDSLAQECKGSDSRCH
jgi:hypothetical protein